MHCDGSVAVSVISGFWANFHLGERWQIRVAAPDAVHLIPSPPALVRSLAPRCRHVPTRFPDGGDDEDDDLPREI